MFLLSFLMFSNGAEHFGACISQNLLFLAIILAAPAFFWDAIILATPAFFWDFVYLCSRRPLVLICAWKTGFVSSQREISFSLSNTMIASGRVSTVKYELIGETSDIWKSLCTLWSWCFVKLHSLSLPVQHRIYMFCRLQLRKPFDCVRKHKTVQAKLPCSFKDLNKKQRPCLQQSCIFVKKSTIFSTGPIVVGYWRLMVGREGFVLRLAKKLSCIVFSSLHIRSTTIIA